MQLKPLTRDNATEGTWQFLTLVDPTAAAGIRKALNAKNCHDKVHHRDWTVEKHPDTARPYLRVPWQKPPKPPDPSLRR